MKLVEGIRMAAEFTGFAFYSLVLVGQRKPEFNHGFLSWSVYNFFSLNFKFFDQKGLRYQ